MTRDLSLGSYILLFAGLSLWLIYGLLLGALPIILGNALACAMAAYIIYHENQARVGNNGVMESWNDGSKKWALQEPNIPLFQHSIVPVFI